MKASAPRNLELCRDTLRTLTTQTLEGANGGERRSARAAAQDLAIDEAERPRSKMSCHLGCMTYFTL